MLISTKRSNENEKHNAVWCASLKMSATHNINVFTVRRFALLQLFAIIVSRSAGRHRSVTTVQCFSLLQLFAIIVLGVLADTGGASGVGFGVAMGAIGLVSGMAFLGLSVLDLVKPGIFSIAHVRLPWILQVCRAIAAIVLCFLFLVCFGVLIRDWSRYNDRYRHNYGWRSSDIQSGIAFSFFSIASWVSTPSESCFLFEICSSHSDTHHKVGKLIISSQRKC